LAGSGAAEARGRRARLPASLLGSRLGRLIAGLNFLALLILIGGALTLNEIRQGLVQTRVDSLTAEGQTFTNLVSGFATHSEPEPTLDVGRATDIVQAFVLAKNQRIRLFDQKGHVLLDSYVLAGTIEERPLAPAHRPGQVDWRWPWQAPAAQREAERHRRAEAELAQEVQLAVDHGQPVAEVRRSESGDRVISVSFPIQRVQAVLGVLTLDAAGVDQIVAAQRAALIPFILIAIAVILGSSLVLNQWVAQPIMRLARAADSVRLSRIRTMSLPDLADRQDEVGDLSRALEAMTAAQSARMDAIERFAADVSHEIKNPLTSMRSAVETLELAPTPQAQSRLLPILKKDVDRLDRLITDIANASRLDAELSRETPRSVDLGKLLADLAGLYTATVRPGEPEVTYSGPPEPLPVSGREGPLGQVFRNLIDNARSFSPAGAAVRLALARGAHHQLIATVEDDGPGMPAENLESVFERFYTQRPSSQQSAGTGGGASVSGHSGLGLSIARQIVEAHGGSIRAENRTEGGVVRGARFVVELPEARV
jgi:two-component system, OmpR family, sensor histidine kinase ChvG